MSYSQRVTALTGIAGSRLADTDGLAGVLLAAAGAIGMSSHGPPIVRSGPRGIVACLLCHGGHVVVHTVPDQSLCIVDILALEPSAADRGVDVIAKRLNGTVQRS